MSGQAASYYDQSQGFDPRGQPNYSNQQNGYQQPPADYQPNYGQPNYPQPDYQQPGYQQPNYQQPPESKPPPQPQYPENPPPPYSTFDQAFKIEKPKYNDLWAGLLVSSPLSR